MKTNTVSKLRISLQEIRNSIDIKKRDWINMDTTNCYAYALGLDIPQSEICDFAYVPGVISNSNKIIPPHKIFSYDTLLNNIYLDLNTLGIDFREINPLDDISMEEWKIALFVTKVYSDKGYVGLEDFHFLRQLRDGFWYHKGGYNGTITRLDSYSDEIVDPQECILENRTYKKCLSLRLK